MELHTYSEFMGEPSGSPFCIKAMCLLEMGSFDWKPKWIADPSKAPKKKLPVLDDGGTIIADSDHIRDYLENKYSVDFDSNLSDRDKAISRLIIRSLEEHLYFVGMADRWMVDGNWKHVKELYFSSLPFPLSLFVPDIVRKQVKGQLAGQGTGRHSQQEQFLRGKKEVDAVEQILGDKAFLFGDDPSAADATAVPFLRGNMVNPHPTPMRDYIAENENLVAYLDRGKEAIYPKQFNA